jgi:hypothetical protein
MDESLQKDEEELLRYIDGDMAGEELDSFETRLSADQPLKSRLESLRMAVEAVDLYGVRNRVSTIHREAIAQASPRLNGKGRVVPMRRIVRYTMAVAASILVIFLCVQGYQFYQLSSQRLYEDAYVAYELSPSRGGGAELTNLEKHYSENRYDEVLKEAAQRNGQLSPRETFVTALASLRQNDTPSAIRWLQELNVPASGYQPDAEFYLALSYLKQKEHGKALQLMEKIRAVEKHPYRDHVSASLIRKTKMLAWKK